jgi:hypothetical protein
MVTRRLPGAEAQVRDQVWSCGITGGQRGTAAGILRLFRVSLPILIVPTVPYSSSSSSFGVGAVGQIVADVPSELSVTPSTKI